MRIENYFHINGLALSFVLKQRLKGLINRDEGPFFQNLHY